MKQKYVKPAMVLERFTLTQNIARDCGPANREWGQPTFGDEANCGWKVPGTDMILWVYSPACNELYGPDDPFEGICYNNPEGGMPIFGS